MYFQHIIRKRQIEGVESYYGMLITSRSWIPGLSSSQLRTHIEMYLVIYSFLLNYLWDKVLASKGYFFRMQRVALRRTDKCKRYLKPYQSTYLPVKGISQQHFFLVLCVAYFNVPNDKVSTTSLGRLEKSHSQDSFSLWYWAWIVFFFTKLCFSGKKKYPK